jgi:uncharacterized membrane protein YraQ (UPF0718 family)
MNSFLQKYSEAVTTSVGFFWMAFWAFSLGYLISSMIQVFVTQERMKKHMGDADPKSVALATFFGFISSSCSFAALATTKSLFKKGAGFVPSLAFLLASTNLVIELGIIISIFLAWQFVIGEYVGGVLLILISWLLVRLLRPKKIVEEARKKITADQESQNTNDLNWKNKISSWAGWQHVAKQYFMEWKMVWKDVTFGFTIAGVISAFVPKSFFQILFINSGKNTDPNFLSILEHVVVAPIAAFCTFIGSMGNIPLASLLYNNGVSFAGIMAFIFSDLVVFPVLRINAKYYGWKMSLFILFLLFTSLALTSLALHYGFNLFDILPKNNIEKISEQVFFEINYTFYLNLFFFALTFLLIWLGYLKKTKKEIRRHSEMASKGLLEKVLNYLAIFSFIWLAIGWVVKYSN